MLLLIAAFITALPLFATVLPTAPLCTVLTDPCRFSDTRGAQGQSGPYGPPSFAAGETRDYDFVTAHSGQPTTCLVPSTAKGVILDVVAVRKSEDDENFDALGHIEAWPTGNGSPGKTSVVNFGASRDTANEVILALSADHKLTFVSQVAPSDIVIDIHGYLLPCPATPPCDDDCDPD